MTTRILVDQTHPLGKLLCEAVDELRTSLDKVNRVKGAIDRMTTGEDPAAPLSVQQEFGLPTVQAAGDLVFLLASAQTALAAPIITEFEQRLDQG